MKRPFRAMALPALALGALVSSGCGPSTANEEGLAKTKAASGDDIPVFKTYGERQLWETEQAAKKKAAAKGAPKGQPAAAKETPATAKEEPKSQ
jgi:hypothetical protein